MPHLPLLRDLIVIFGLSVVVVFIFQKLRQPVIVGFLATGVIFGPSGFGFIAKSEEVETLAEIGVILLLFTIGVEFSLSRLARTRRETLWGGSLQVFGTALIAFLASLPFQLGWAQSVVLGFLIAISSTAIVLRVFAERGEMMTPHAGLSLGILIFQDFFVVPIMLLIPMLSGWQQFSWLALLQVLGMSVITVALILLAARFAIPPILQLAVGTRSREVFLISIILVILGTAWLTSLGGLSLALGAFVAGLVVSQSEYSHQVLSDILPFRDAFNSIFFVSIGMLMDVRFFFDNALPLTLLVLLVMGVKFLVITPIAGFLGYSLRAAVHTGVALSQIGEFSFILALLAHQQGLLSNGVYRTFLSVSVLTMLISPFLMRTSSFVGERLERVTDLRRLFPPRVQIDFEPEISSAETRPVLIIGYGLNGWNLAQALRRMNIPYRVLELNGDTVRRAAAEGEPIVYGDSTSREILKKIGVRWCRAMVVAISDPAATERTVQLARALNPSLPILVRTKYVREIDELYRLGADEVVPEEFEAAVELCNRTLRRVGIPGNLIVRELRAIREERYQRLQVVQPRPTHVEDLPEGLLGANVETHTVLPKSWAVGRSLRDLDLRAVTGASVIAVVQGSEVQASPDPDRPLVEKDVVVLMGSADRLAVACHLLDHGPEGSPVPNETPAG